MSKPVINIADIELQLRPPAFAPTGEAAKRYDARMGMVSMVLGAKKLGYNITAIPPGKCAFPLHSHHVNEEMVFVLEGTGEVRIGDAVYQILQGDFVAMLAGNKDTAHQIINTGSVELKYLAVSTRMSPEICEYPTSGKFGIYSETPAGSDGKPGFFRFVGHAEQSAGYWEGE
jgi:uncharacterized cupin superfamily protein